MTQTSARLASETHSPTEASPVDATVKALDAFAALAASLPLEDKVRLLTGQTAWRTHAIESLGLRSMAVSDGPVGVRGTGEIPGVSSVLMPSPSALAATWDVNAAARAGHLFATEARRLGVDVVLAPQVNLQRTPVGGRHFECYSEDPLLTSVIAGATVAAMQAAGVAACLKHFIANDSETARTAYVSVVDEQTLREVYLAPFDYLIHEVGVWSVMAAYNGVDAYGEISTMTAHSSLLNDLLKDEWGFDGVVVSDWMATRSTVESANGGLDLIMPGPGGPWEDHLLEAVRSGAVAEATITDKVARLLLLASRVGALAPATTAAAEPREDDQAFVRRLAAESMVVLKGEGALPIATEPASIALVGPNAVSAYVLGGGSSTVNPHHIVDPLQGLQSAYPTATITLLRGGAARVHTPKAASGSLVSGPDAVPGIRVTLIAADGSVVDERIDADWSGWLYDIPTPATRVRLSGAFRLDTEGEHRIDLGSVGTYAFTLDGDVVARSDAFADANVILDSSINAPYGVGATLEIDEPRDVPFSVDLTVIEAGGYGRLIRADLRHQPPGEDTDAEIAEAVAAAASAELTVVVVGTNAEVESEGFDRHSLALPGRQDELVERVLEVDPNAVIVINAGAPVLLPWLAKARTVLWAWFPGQECGHALGDVLAGRAEPSGRLPWTLPASEADVPVPHALPDAEMRVHYGEGVHVGYRGWERSGAVPAAPFGHGLGWTTWSYDAVRQSITTADGVVEFEVTVTNTGERAGAEVVQAYVTSSAELPEGIDRPVRWLAGFARVTVAAGESATATISVSRRTLEVWHGGVWHLPHGTYAFEFGRSIRDARLSSDLRLPPVEGEENGSAGEVRSPD